MTITNCDVCGTDFTAANDVVKVSVRTYGFLASEFRADCGQPVVLVMKGGHKQMQARENKAGKT
jgi:hypothetical protein